MLISDDFENSDEWIEKRDQKKKLIQECQKSKSLSSCFECDKLIGCEIRGEYVKAVYESMSKGATGGFEF